MLSKTLFQSLFKKGDEDDEVFLENSQNVEVQIKVDPPSGSVSNSTNSSKKASRESSPVFYLEPDDWSDDIPKVVTSPTR